MTRRIAGRTVAGWGAHLGVTILALTPVALVASPLVLWGLAVPVAFATSAVVDRWMP